jgi:flagellar assembly factor FliW
MVKVEAMSKEAVETSRFGVIEFDKEKILTFTEGLPGFQEAKQFILVPHSDNSPLKWLQSLDIPELAFAVLDPWLLFSDYKPVFNPHDLESLEMENSADEDLAIVTILTIPEDPQEMTANLKAPIIINAKSNKAKQVVLLSDDYLIKQPLPQSK